MRAFKRGRGVRVRALPFALFALTLVAASRAAATGKIQSAATANHRCLHQSTLHNAFIEAPD
jgi:hypothetical protein